MHVSHDGVTARPTVNVGERVDALEDLTKSPHASNSGFLLLVWKWKAPDNKITGQVTVMCVGWEPVGGEKSA
jgi:hypothetical protein